MAAILTYHALEESEAVTAVRPARFRSHMAMLEGRYEVVDLARLVQHLASAEPLPSKWVAITFDDGYRSVYTVALPELRRRGFPATVFVTSGHCGGWNDWPGEGAEAPRREMLSLDELRELHGAGVAIGAHSVTHPVLTDLPIDGAVQEIEESRRWLEERLSAPVDRFAYPYGVTDRRLRDHVAARFDLGCGTDLRLLRDGDDRWELPRIDAFYLDGILRLGGLDGDAAGVYVWLRRALRRSRARLAWRKSGGSRP